MTDDSQPIRELIVCSLEPWDDVWRRNQFLVNGLLNTDPELRVLFVEPAHDLVGGIVRGTMPPVRGPHVARERLWTFQPTKPLPRIAGPWADWALARQVSVAARGLGFTSPVLWVNDLVYAPLARLARWPVLYDITDDWLVESSVPRRVRRRRARREAALLADANEVVVCSPGLAESRGALRAVRLIPNGVDTACFAVPVDRPADLPTGPVAVYVGTLHEERLDVRLVIEVSDRLPGLQVALVGPDALSGSSHAALAARHNVHVLGPRPHQDVPGYLQHADVIVVPHLVNPFTESLDPIKAYECLAVGRPTVATPVAGFRGLGPPVVVADRARFVGSVEAALSTPPPSDRQLITGIDWQDRCAAFGQALAAAAAGRWREDTGTAEAVGSGQ